MIRRRALFCSLLAFGAVPSCVDGSNPGAGDGGPTGGDDGGTPPGTAAPTDAAADADGTAASADGADGDAFAEAEAEAATTTAVNLWTWANGGTATGAAPVYGTQATPAAANTPGARYGSAAWTDNGGNLWLFGGTPAGSNATLRNDLWKWDGAAWTWVLGSSTVNALATYGTKGQAGAGNGPGARLFPGFARDAAGAFWLFGGNGLATTTSPGELDDVWKFNGSQWTWVAGSNATNTAATFGTKGQAAAGNTPGGRERPVTWVDGSGNLWVFGGRDSGGDGSDHADLWKFDGASWTWVWGAQTTNTAGVFGTKGQAATTNAPGARQDAVGWIDNAGHLWLYGGYGYDGAGALGDLSDLWTFDGASWTWVTGSKTKGTPAVYGSRGVAAATNDPGPRENAVAWRDAGGAFWVFGGTSAHNTLELDDLWKFDGTAWTWVSGASTTDPVGTYGTLGVVAPANAPGGRDSAAGWIDGAGNLWLFGGWAWGAASDGGAASDINDLWKYQP